MNRVIGYVRVSTSDQDTEAQRFAIINECQSRGWQLVTIEEDAATSGSIPWRERPGLSRAVTAIEAKDADVLMAAKLDRLSRSLVDFASLLERSQKRRWSINLLDFGLDMTTPVGEMVASILAAVSQFERRRIGERTKEGLARRKAAGVHIGRKSSVPLHVLEDMLEARSLGLTYRDIADKLNEAQVPTPHGGRKWWPSTVQQIIVRQS